MGPLLGFVRPTERLQRVLVWEGSLIDPVGGILGALVFHAIMASSHKGLEQQRQQIGQAGLELAPGELLAAATGRGARLEGITAVFLLTGEDDFNALASALLQGSVGGQVYRLAPPHSHGVVAPYTGAEILFDDRMTRSELSRRYQHGEHIVTQPGGSGLPAGHDILFLVRADRKLAAVTESSRPAPQAGDTIASLGPPPAALRHGRDAAPQPLVIRHHPKPHQVREVCMPLQRDDHHRWASRIPEPGLGRR